MVDKPAGPTPPGHGPHNPHDAHGSHPAKGPTKGSPQKSQGTEGADKAHGSAGVHYKGGQIQAKPMTFLGMYFDADEAKKLWTIISNTINNQISHDQARALKAIKKLKKAEQGDDDYDSD